MRAASALLLLLLTVSPVLGQEVGFRWKFAEGDKESYRLTQTAKLDLTLTSGKEIETKVVRELDWSWEVKSVTEDGSATLAIQVNRIQLKVTGPTGDVTKFDSESEEEPRGFGASMAPLFRTLMKSELKAQLTTRGEIKSFEIPEDLELALSTKPVGKAVGTLGDKQDLLPLANLAMPVFPIDSRQTGELWEAEHSRDTVPFGSTMATTVYKVDTVNDEEAEVIATFVPETKISFIGSDSGEPEALITEQQNSGKILFNVTTGRVESFESKEQLNLETNGGFQPATGKLLHEMKIEKIED